MRCLPHSEENSLDVLPLFNLRSGPKILAACRELRPHVVVLQLGHYEAPAPLRKSLGLKIAKKKSAKCATKPWLPRPEMQYRLTCSMIFAEVRRLLAGGMIVVLGKKERMFNSGVVAEDLDSILSSLKELPMRGIVLVGPFSAPDPLTRFCRQKVAPIFEAAAEKYGCTFIDVFSFLESFPKGRAYRENFADHEHLSALGHQRLGALVGEALAKVLENSTTTGVQQSKTKPAGETRLTARPGWVGKPAVASRSQTVGAA